MRTPTKNVVKKICKILRDERPDYIYLRDIFKKIREESKLSETNSSVMAINAHIEEGQEWRHYKGTMYKIVSVAKNSNVLAILDIHYADAVGKTWALPIHEFTKTVMHEGKEVLRFSFEG